MADESLMGELGKKKDGDAEVAKGKGKEKGKGDETGKGAEKKNEKEHRRGGGRGGGRRPYGGHRHPKKRKTELVESTKITDAKAKDVAAPKGDVSAAAASKKAEKKPARKKKKKKKKKKKGDSAPILVSKESREAQLLLQKVDEYDDRILAQPEEQQSAMFEMLADFWKYHRTVVDEKEDVISKLKKLKWKNAEKFKELKIKEAAMEEKIKEAAMEEAEVAELKTQLKKLKIKEAANETEVAELKRQLEELDEQVTERDERLKEKDEQIEGQYEKIKELTQKISKLERPKELEEQ